MARGEAPPGRSHTLFSHQEQGIQLLRLACRHQTGKQKVVSGYRLPKTNKQTKMQPLSQNQSLLFCLSLPRDAPGVSFSQNSYLWTVNPQKQQHPNSHWTILNSITLHRALNRILLETSSSDWPRDSLGSVALFKWSKVTPGSTLHIQLCRFLQVEHRRIRKKTQILA